MNRIARAALPLLAVVPLACRQPPASPSTPGTPPPEPVSPGVPSVTSATPPATPLATPPASKPATAAAAAQAYLADHHLNWGKCLLAVPSFDGDTMMTFARTDGAPGDPHTLLVHPDGSVMVAPDQ